MRTGLVLCLIVGMTMAGCTQPAPEERSVAISYTAHNGFTGDRSKPLSCGEWAHLSVHFNDFTAGEVWVQVLGGDDQKEFEFTFEPGHPGLERDLQGIPGIWTLKVETTDGDLGFTAGLSCTV